MHYRYSAGHKSARGRNSMLFVCDRLCRSQANEYFNMEIIILKHLTCHCNWFDSMGWLFLLHFTLPFSFHKHVTCSMVHFCYTHTTVFKRRLLSLEYENNSMELIGQQIGYNETVCSGNATGKLQKSFEVFLAVFFFFGCSCVGHSYGLWNGLMYSGSWI